MKTLIAALALAAALVSSYSLGQDAYPAKPIQVVLPLQAASASDIAVRIVAEKMAELLGQGMVVENVAGVGGLIGTNRVATARPDGYTLAALNNSILTILPHMQKGAGQVRHLRRLRAAARLRHHPDLPRRAEGFAVHHRAAGDRPREGQARRAQLLERRAGQPAAPRHRDVPAHGRHPADPHPVQGRDGRGGRSRRRPGPAHVHLALARAALPARTTACASSPSPAPSAAAPIPRSSTVAESGVPGYDYGSWIGALRAEGHARGRAGEAARGQRAGDGDARARRAPREKRPGDLGPAARAARRGDARRTGSAGKRWSGRPSSPRSSGFTSPAGSSTTSPKRATRTASSSRCGTKSPSARRAAAHHGACAERRHRRAPIRPRCRCWWRASSSS